MSRGELQAERESDKVTGGGINPPDLFFRGGAAFVPVCPETRTPQDDKAE